MVSPPTRRGRITAGIESLVHPVCRGESPMKSTTLRLTRDRRGSRVPAFALLALPFVLLRGEADALAQAGASDRWVSTWATAEVGRPQNPVPPAAPLPPFIVNTRCPAPPAPPVVQPPGQSVAPPPFIHF